MKLEHLMGRLMPLCQITFGGKVIDVVIGYICIRIMRLLITFVRLLRLLNTVIIHYSHIK
jgi:hypothetical protein